MSVAPVDGVDDKREGGWTRKMVREKEMVLGEKLGLRGELLVGVSKPSTRSNFAGPGPGPAGSQIFEIGSKIFGIGYLVPLLLLAFLKI